MLELLHHAPTHAAYPDPLLFVHGVCHGAWCWEDHWLPWFAANGWHSYALSLRGHGGSPGRESLHSFGLDDYVDDVLQTVDRIGGRPVLIGHSMGGGVVQQAMLKAPHRLRAAVLLASTPPGWLRPLEQLRLLLSLPMMVKVRRLMNGQDLTIEDVLGMPFFDHRITPSAAVRYAPLLQPESRRATAEIPRLSTPGGTPAVPLLVVGSRRDRLFGDGALRRTADHYGTTAIVLEEGCHDLMLDPDWQNSAGHVLRWLQALPAV